MDEKAKELAQALVNEKKTNLIKTFTIEGTDEKIVVIVQRVDAKRATKLTEITKSVAGPWGKPCPCCNGTGKIS